MPAECTLTKWDDSGGRTNNFSAVFKALDFGNPSSHKIISNIYVTFNHDSDVVVSISLLYRTNASDSFTTIGSFVTTTSGTEEIKEIKLPSPLKVKTFQLKLIANQTHDGSFNISDVTILYRPLRDYTTEGTTSEV